MLFMPRTTGPHTFYPGDRIYSNAYVRTATQPGTDYRLQKWSFMGRDKSIRVLSEPCSVRIRRQVLPATTTSPTSHLPAPFLRDAHQQ